MEDLPIPGWKPFILGGLHYHFTVEPVDDGVSISIGDSYSSETYYLNQSEVVNLVNYIQRVVYL